jgi:hypothetical protein
MLESFLLFAAINRMWYAVPLVVTISLVYGATRHELPRPILEHAVRFGAWIVGFMAVLFLVIWWVSQSL